MMVCNFSKQRKNIFRKNIIWLLCMVFFLGLALNGCCHRQVVYSKSLFGAQTESSIQLLEDRSLGTLRDRLTVYKDSCNDEIYDPPIFHIYNRTMHALTVNLYGSEGSYTFVLEPKRDGSWVVNSGEYSIEIGVPGFPSAAVDGLSLATDRIYKWEFWKTRNQ